MASADELREAANRAFEEGRFEEALQLFADLERIENDPEWARRAAQAYHGLGDRAAEVEALNRAARGYQARGDILKAAVTSKLIIALDPTHAETLKRIPELVARRDKELENRPRPQALAASSPDGVLKIANAISSFYLRDLLPRRPRPPGASATPASGTTLKPITAGVHPIPLRGDLEDDFHLEIIIEEPEELGAEPLYVDSAGNIVAESGAKPPADAPARSLSSADLPPSPLAVDALKSTLFAELAPDTFATLLLLARIVDLPKRRELFHQGDPGDAMYVIVSGALGVVDEGPPRRGLTMLGEHKVFGEIALLTNQPRTATIVALSDSQLIAIDREVVGKLTAKDPHFLDLLLRFLRDRLVERLLTTNPLFTVLSNRDREALKPRFKLLEVDAGAVLIEEGKKPDGLIILLAGKADVVRRKDQAEVTLGQLMPGDIAGEISLLTNIPAIGTVRAAERSLAVLFPASAFQTIINARPDAMSFVKRLIEQRTAQARDILSGSAPHVEGHVRGDV